MVRPFDLGALAVSSCVLSGCFILFHGGEGAGGAGGQSTSSATASGVTATTDGITATSDGAPGVGVSSGSVTDCVQAGGQCAPAPATGWSIPTVEVVASPCDGATTVALTGGTPGVNAMDPCICTGTGVGCILPGVQLYPTPPPQGSCGPANGELDVSPLFQGTCTAVQAGFVPTGFGVTDLPTVVGSCDPVPNQVGPSPYGQEVSLCSLPAAPSACPSPSVCAPAGLACVFQAGSVPCEAPYTKAQPALIQSTVTCTCSPPTGTCDGNVAVFSSPSCALPNQIHSFDATNINCTDFTIGVSTIGLKYDSAKTPSCADGKWLVSSPQTFTVCCLP